MGPKNNEILAGRLNYIHALVPKGWNFRGFMESFAKRILWSFWKIYWEKFAAKSYFSGKFTQ